MRVCICVRGGEGTVVMWGVGAVWVLRVLRAWARGGMGWGHGGVGYWGPWRVGWGAVG